MPWYSGEQMEAARRMTAIEYLQRYQPYRLKKSTARNEWELTDHDSFKINGITSQWHWKSRDIGGISALNFLVKVDGMDFKEAVELLLRENPAYIPPMPKEKEPKPFVLPERYCNCRRVQEYLNQRGISDGVIRYCRQSGLLYESTPYHNAVFVGKDTEGFPDMHFYGVSMTEMGNHFGSSRREVIRNMHSVSPQIGRVSGWLYMKPALTPLRI